MQAAVRCSSSTDVRAARPTDASAMQAFVDGLSLESRRLRFHGAVSRCSQGLLQQLISHDGVSHVALVALDGTAGVAPRMVGEARFVVDGDDDGRRAEFAISVADEVRGRGIADELMKRLFAVARATGIDVLHGDVLDGNGRMATFLRRHGFELAWDVDAGPGVARWERSLCAVSAGWSLDGLRRWLRRELWIGRPASVLQ